MKRIAIAAAGLVLALGATAPASAANDLDVNANAALGGTNFGMEVLIDAAGNETVYVESDHPVDESHMLLRFRVNMQNLTGPQTGGARHIRFMQMITDGASPGASKVFFAQRQLGSGNWRLIVWSYDTSASQFVYVGSLFLAGFGASVDAHIECEWTEASGAASADGSFSCAKLGTAQQFQSATLNDFGRDIDRVRVGFFDFDAFPGSGSYDFDEYESYR